MSKLFKDPVYGYVKIEANIVNDIIDSVYFQRLRNIRQTSYAPLYPASFHNRFIHSKEEKNIHEKKNIINDKDYGNLIDGITKIKKWVYCLKKISDENDFPFDYAIIGANKFKSGFMKQDLEKILICFPSLALNSCIKEISTILSSTQTRERFFYLFFRNSGGVRKKEIDINGIAAALCKELFI